jgi:hypothetical protein
MKWIKSKSSDGNMKADELAKLSTTNSVTEVYSNLPIKSAIKIFKNCSKENLIQKIDRDKISQTCLINIVYLII